MDENRQVTSQDLQETFEELAGSRASVIAKNAVTAQGIRAVARVPEAVAKNTGTFDVEVRQGKRCDQERSGRCWMFASLNTMRSRVIDRLGLKTFELSQAFPLFYDKVEKSNWFLENVLDTLDEPLDGRLMAHLLADPVGDGGQWDMFRSLVKKYGVCPKEAMPETACSRNTREMDDYLTRYLRGTARRLRESHEAGVDACDLQSMKAEMIREVTSLLMTCFGEPPATFDVRLRDKGDKLVLKGTFTPRSFFEQVVDMNADDYVSVISANTADKPFGHTYTVSRLGNVVEDGGVRYLNLPVEGALTRSERLDYGESVMTHAMVLEGVNLDEAGHPTLWKVENSWGDERGKDGFDSITDAWFDEYVYQVVVDKRFLSDEERHTYETEEPRVLAPWDLMGTLALTR